MQVSPLLTIPPPVYNLHGLCICVCESSLKVSSSQPIPTTCPALGDNMRRRGYFAKVIWRLFMRCVRHQITALGDVRLATNDLMPSNCRFQLCPVFRLIYRRPKKGCVAPDMRHRKLASVNREKSRPFMGGRQDERGMESLLGKPLFELVNRKTAA